MGCSAPASRRSGTRWPSLVADSGAAIKLRQSKYLNNIVEQDHRTIEHIVRPMLGFKSFRCTSILIAGIETMHMIKKGQLNGSKDRASSSIRQSHARSRPIGKGQSDPYSTCSSPSIVLACSSVSGLWAMPSA